MQTNARNRLDGNASDDESHDVERGDEIVVDGVRNSRNPMTVRMVYNDGTIKAIDQFDGIYEVRDDDVSDRVDVVNDDKLQLDEEEDDSDCAHYTLHDEPAHLGGEQYARCIHCDSEAVGEPEQVLHDEGCKLRRDWR